MLNYIASQACPKILIVLVDILYYLLCTCWLNADCALDHRLDTHPLDSSVFDNSVLFIDSCAFKGILSSFGKEDDILLKAHWPKYSNIGEPNQLKKLGISDTAAPRNILRR